MKRHGLLIAGTFLICAFAGCGKTPAKQFESYITEQQYQEIKTGMTKEEVLAKLGTPSGGDTSRGLLQYHIKSGGRDELVVFYFAEGKVFQIHRATPKPPGSRS